jgi:hypothetical protein
MNKEELKKFLNEETMNPVKKLTRSIHYHTRKGSAHILNKVSNDIEKTIDPTQQTPDFAGVKDHELPVQEISLINYINEDYVATDEYIRTKNNITYFGEASSDSQLKKLLYRERLRNNKEVFLLYDRIKEEVPDIKYTYINYERYKQNNLFVDLFYYNRIFFENNMYKMDRGINLYLDLLSKFINDNRLKEAGYDNKIVFIPIQDWDINPETKMWMYNEDINPVSVFFRLMNTNIPKLKNIFNDIDFVFVTDRMYFKVNFSEFNSDDVQRFLFLFKSLRNNESFLTSELDDGDMKQDSNKAIVNTILDDIESSQNIKMYGLTGDNKQKQANDKGTSVVVPSGETDDSKVIKIDADKKELIDKVEKAAEKSNTVDDALDILDKDEEFKKMLLDLSSEEIDGNIVNNARASRIAKLDEELLDKQVQGKTIKEILKSKEEMNEKELDKTSLPIDSINPEWKELSYINMANQYDPNVDIVAMLAALSKKTYPISIRNIDVDDASTSEDYIVTYRVEMENHVGKRFTLKFDIPKFKNNQYMMLRGNRKTISSQSFLMPIIKTDEDTVQIVSNYNKIFVRRFGVTTGKSNVICDKIIKTINKGTFKDIKVITGDNLKVCSKYELPIDYIDLSSIYTKIETKDAILYFNQKELREKYNKEIDYKQGLPIGENYLL